MKNEKHSRAKRSSKSLSTTKRIQDKILEKEPESLLYLNFNEKRNISNLNNNYFNDNASTIAIEIFNISKDTNTNGNCTFPNGASLLEFEIKCQRCRRLAIFSEVSEELYLKA
ncbi:hypothetical protein RF11_08788 [Thelohanellus kitauei]|uniref:Uncharacterized protein n=1 Tax=Thelohanellus kitauei TaxID=669202 RepID=A0A0C2NBF9_THEKT|nr:hypothetical protein RF11_08788 [Thelohanellus kitauei]